MGETFLRLVDTRHITAREPPERQVDAAELLEPFTSLPEQLGVGRFVNVGPKRIHCFPNRKVEKDAIVIVGTKVSRISCFSLQSPYEPRAAIGERVDLIEALNEPGHDRVLERRSHPGDV